VFGSIAALHPINAHLIICVAVSGAFVFGISGGLAGVQARLDLFGVGVIAAIVGLSGGVLRDVLLGTKPVVVFDWRVVISVMGAAIVSYVFRGRLVDWKDSVEVFDAIGLSLFCVIGTYISLQDHSGPIPAIILGTITAIGGGIVRDILLRRIPAVLREGLYAIPALLGATVVVVGYEFGIATLAWYGFAAGSCLLVRIVGMVFHINLPVAAHPS
jgi:uncharacterized membrane protein YeiH